MTSRARKILEMLGNPCTSSQQSASRITKQAPDKSSNEKASNPAAQLTAVSKCQVPVNKEGAMRAGQVKGVTPLLKVSRNCKLPYKKSVEVRAAKAVVNVAVMPTQLTKVNDFNDTASMKSLGLPKECPESKVSKWLGKNYVESTFPDYGPPADTPMNTSIQDDSGIISDSFAEESDAFNHLKTWRPSRDPNEFITPTGPTTTIVTHSQPSTRVQDNSEIRNIRNNSETMISPNNPESLILERNELITPVGPAAFVIRSQPSTSVQENVEIRKGLNARKRLFDGMDQVELPDGGLLLIPESSGPCKDNSFPATPLDSGSFDQVITGDNSCETTIHGPLSSVLLPNESISVPVPESNGTCGKKKRTRTAVPATDEPSRKRKLNPTKWKAAETKRLANLGLAHTTLRGKALGGKVMKIGCDEKCRRNCSFKITEERRKVLFDKYWGLGAKDLQWYFITKLVYSKPVERRKVLLIEDEDPHRKCSYEYSLTDSSCNRVIVCQKMFLATFSISKTVVRSALIKNSPDKRGKHTQNRKRIFPELVDGVKTHIKSFPMVPSHYCRMNSSRKYLDENLNVSLMHRLYIVTRDPNDPHSASLRQYRDIFNSYFNLGFFKPKKDQCSLCHEFNSLHSTEINEELTLKYRTHKQDKEHVRALKKSNKEASKEDNGKRTRVLTADLQKVLYTPTSNVGEFFYKRKLSCYNYTIYDCTKKEGHLYVWDQTVARRGSDETASSMLDYLEAIAKEGVVLVYVYSDSCSGQNKSKYFLTMYYAAAMKFEITIVHRYLEKGHTQMEADSVHARIEKKGKNKDVYTPNEWYGIMKSAKVKKPAYKVNQIKQEEIFTFRGIAASHFQWSKVPLTKVKEIEFSSSCPGAVMYKTSWQEEKQHVASILLQKVGRPINWKTYKPKLAYTGRIPLKPKLVNDLKWYLQKGHIPAAHAPFYEALFEIENREDGSINLEVDVPPEVLEDEDDVPQEIVPEPEVVNQLAGREYFPDLDEADPSLLEDNPQEEIIAASEESDSYDD